MKPILMKKEKKPKNAASILLDKTKEMVVINKKNDEVLIVNINEYNSADFEEFIEGEIMEDTEIRNEIIYTRPENKKIVRLIKKELEMKDTGFISLSKYPNGN